MDVKQPEADRLCASQNDPSGLYQGEAFENSLEDSVNFRFPSWRSLGGIKTIDFCRLQTNRLLTILRWAATKRCGISRKNLVLKG